MFKQIVTTVALSVTAMTAMADAPCSVNNSLDVVELKEAADAHTASKWDIMALQYMVGAEVDGKYGPNTRRTTDQWLYSCGVRNNRSVSVTTPVNNNITMYTNHLSVGEYVQNFDITNNADVGYRKALTQVKSLPDFYVGARITNVMVDTAWSDWRADHEYTFVNHYGDVAVVRVDTHVFRDQTGRADIIKHTKAPRPAPVVVEESVDVHIDIDEDAAAALIFLGIIGAMTQND
ncbi:MAG: hypothetical protein N0C84_00535 [Candidatus Thiodiazotropha taylori]|uniref:Peptidoglycan binding-like domain-containing protein n=1 Tax=Candidatus Thiodiazotropha taylori TaxID=2792791 RepID=A0A9E4N1I2_9GAMM|nr:hypothetical protein [Candidatus Thiodiazotropha taylori]MCW4254931.1 hypothetical protein [Candidatus Thiodiazotropha taylori]